MEIKERVIKHLETLIADTSLFVVGVTVSESKIRRKVSVFLDSDQGITIEECSKVSRELGNLLEEEIEDAFTLEVSSPGADSPLLSVRQYAKNIGRTLKVLKKDLSELKGKLLEVSEESIVIETEAKKKIKPEVITVQLEEIKEAKVVISFK